MKMQCEQISNNHSNEKILVWIGDEVPWILCGYHASQISSSLLWKIRDAGISYTPCIECDELIDTDTHTEELGMCVDCSNAYYTHDEENETNLTLVIEGENK
jgi:hypothetical protein